jgi:hypothetical protein
MNSLAKFLQSHKVNDELKQSPTHTRIGNKTLNIFGGSYYISDEDLDEFHSLYYNHIFINRNKEYLTEKQNGFAIAVDLDLRYSWDVEKRLHNESTIINILSNYTNSLIEMYDFKNGDNFDVFVLEKDNINRLPDKSLTKDGIHLLINIKMEHDLQMILREKIIKKTKDEDGIIINFNSRDKSTLALTNTLNTVFDESITRGTTNWMLFGSQKPENEPYKIVQAYNMIYDIDTFCDNEIENLEMNLDLFKKLSVQNKNNPSFPLKNKYKLLKETKQEVKQESKKEINNNKSSDYFIIDKAIDYGLLNDKAIDYKDWLNMMFGIKYTLGEEGYELFDKFSQLCPDKYNEDDIKKNWDVCKDTNKKPITMGSIVKWCKDNDNNKYKEILKLEKERKNDILIKTLQEEKQNDNEIDKMINNVIQSATDNSFAKLFHFIYGNEFKCVDVKNKLFYNFNKNKLWEEDNSGSNIRLILSNEMKQLFQDKINKLDTKIQSCNDEDLIKLLEKERKVVNEVMLKLEKRNEKNNISAEIYDLIKDIEFEKQLNKVECLMPLNNGMVLDMNTLERRERTIEDKFSFCCNAEYIEDDDEWVDKYFKSLFCDNLDTLQCFLDCIKTTFSGNLLRYLFICSGSGSNGKSLLFKCIGQIFNGFMDIISEKVIIQSKTQSNLNTEIEKLDKIRLGFLSELSEGDKLNEKMIKSISGGDPINLRTICKTDKTIYPTSTLWIAVNDEPEFKTEKAMINRIVNFPFNNSFPVDLNFEKELLGKKNEVFSYIMKHGRINNVVNPSAEMIEKKRQYIADQESNDLLKSYIDDYIELNVPEITGKGMKEKWCIKRDKFIESYKTWCKINDYKIKEITPTKFTSDLLKKYGICNDKSGGNTWYENIQYKEIIEEKEE